MRHAVPVAVGIMALALWEALVRLSDVPPYILPTPGLVIAALGEDGGTLFLSAWFTLVVTVKAFVVALVAGVALALLFAVSPLAERALFPYAVILQVTPVVAIAPLVILWVGFDNVGRAQLIL
ncbi:MAG TPA: ABC transporter permease, partial [Azospirillaceae bacterium]|nr:ABC transporter permease [Azospirillaceae bacterium]